MYKEYAQSVIRYIYTSGTTKQDFAYTYDALGNILNITDATPDAGIAGIGSLSRVFNYDALYRLLQATGRENLPHTTNPYYKREQNSDPTLTSGYTQAYQFDKLGNIIELKHRTVSGTGNFNRMFCYDDITHNNLLTSATVWGDTYTFEYDTCGNQTLQSLDRHMAWDYADRMKAFFSQAGMREPSKYASRTSGTTMLPATV